MVRKNSAPCWRLAAAAAFAFSVLAAPAAAQYTQQGNKLVGATVYFPPAQGTSVAISADGNTMIVGGPGDGDPPPGPWVYVRNGTTWTEQARLATTSNVGNPSYGASVALSADGNTALIGGPQNRECGGHCGGGDFGAVWVFTRSGTTWSEQAYLIGDPAKGATGTSVALSADGNIAVAGAPGYDDAGAVRVFTRSGATWTQTQVLTGSAAAGSFSGQGTSVAISSSGDTIVFGGPNDNDGAGGTQYGAVWVFERSGGVWSEQQKLIGAGSVATSGQVWQGTSIALSSDGNTLATGAPLDDNHTGAVWVFTRSGSSWTPQGGKLVPSGGGSSDFGASVTLSADGNTLAAGGPSNNSDKGATWVFTRSGGTWTPLGTALVGTGATAGDVNQGKSVSLSGDSGLLAVGGPADDSVTGAVWVFARDMVVSPATNIAASGQAGGPFSPSQFDYTLSAPGAAKNFSVSGVPSWLDVSASAGTVPSAGQTVVSFTVNSNANILSANVYGPVNITIVNATDSTTVRTVSAMLTVNAAAPAVLQVSPATNMAWSGTQAGPFTPGTINYTLSASQGSVQYQITGAPTWLGVSAPNGTVTTGGSTVSFFLSPDADGFAPGTYGPVTINFINTGTGQGTTTRTATLTVNAPPPPSGTLLVTPASNVAASGNKGGPFVPGSFNYILTANSGSVDYSISGVPSWLTASATSGTVTTAGSAVTFTVNNAANALAAGQYAGAITFSNLTNPVQVAPTRSATLTVSDEGPTTLVSAVLPASRSVQVGAAATAFATIINTGTAKGINCGLSLGTPVPASFSYQTTNPATNAVTGSANLPVNIEPGASQSYVFAITTGHLFAPTDVSIDAKCANSAKAPTVIGLNTLLVAASETPIADIVALAATPSNDGIVNIVGEGGSGAFAVATVNVGATAAITVSADTGAATLPVSLLICQTSPATANCLAPPAATVTTTIPSNATPTFSIFATASGAIPFDPAANRIFVRFKDSGGATRGSTSVAVRTQ